MSEEKLLKIVEFFEDEMIQGIIENWPGGEKGMSKSEAATYLGHSTRGMSQEEIDDEVSELQLAYYEEGEASLEEIVDKFVEVMEL